MPDAATCPLCAACAFGTWVKIDAWLRRVQSLARSRCLCDTHQHRPLVQHPHTHEGCAGYAWQRLAIPQEVPRGLD
jgi:hypothetical protein